MKILLAVDGSPCGDLAVEEIGRRPWPTDSTIKILHVYEPLMNTAPEGWPLPKEYVDDMERAMREQAQSIVNRSLAQLRTKLDQNVLIESEFLPGSPRWTILEEAERWEADLIVVGSHGYGLWQRFLLGSVSQSVMSHAKCSVEVVRCRSVSQDKSETEQSQEKR